MSKEKIVTGSNLLLMPCAVVGALVLLQGCSPTVKLEAPAEPITINLNIKLDAEVRLKIEENAKDDINDNPEIF